MVKIDLRQNDWREAILNIEKALNESKLNKRALGLLIADCTHGINLTQAMAVLDAIPTLSKRYLKK